MYNALDNKRYSIEDALTLSNHIISKRPGKRMEIVEINDGLTFEVSANYVNADPHYRRVYKNVTDLRNNESQPGASWFPAYTGRQA